MGLLLATTNRRPMTDDQRSIDDGPNLLPSPSLRALLATHLRPTFSPFARYQNLIFWKAVDRIKREKDFSRQRVLTLYDTYIKNGVEMQVRGGEAKAACTYAAEPKSPLFPHHPVHTRANR